MAGMGERMGIIQRDHPRFLIFNEMPKVRMLFDQRP